MHDGEETSVIAPHGGDDDLRPLNDEASELTIDDPLVDLLAESALVTGL